MYMLPESQEHKQDCPKHIKQHPHMISTRHVPSAAKQKLMSEGPLQNCFNGLLVLASTSRSAENVVHITFFYLFSECKVK